MSPISHSLSMMLTSAGFGPPNKGTADDRLRLYQAAKNPGANGENLAGTVADMIREKRLDAPTAGSMLSAEINRKDGPPGGGTDQHRRIVTHTLRALYHRADPREAAAYAAKASELGLNIEPGKSPFITGSAIGSAWPTLQADLLSRSEKDREAWM